MFKVKKKLKTYNAKLIVDDVGVVSQATTTATSPFWAKVKFATVMPRPLGRKYHIKIKEVK